ncbi:MAG: S41 family peptidase [Nonlabens sp.]
MKLFRNFFILCVALTTIGCADDLDDVFANESDIKNFIYRGLNTFYLYKPEVDVLADAAFASTQELEEFHSQFPSPEAWFESLIFDRERTDRFSILVQDYVALENLLSGSSLSNGLEFGLVAESGSPTAVYGYVRYVQPGSSAAAAGIMRGQIFNRVNGIALTRSNLNTLLSPTTYTIGFATLSAGTTTDLPEEVELTKTAFQEDPILLTRVIDQGSQKIGYLVYNSFLSQFDEQLNGVFADFAAQGVTHLVLDLRYNGGGSVNTAVILGSLISGNPVTDVYSTEEWNPDIQQFFMDNEPERLVNFFKNQTDNGTPLNSLNLSRVHILTTPSTASASELVINSLEPYIDVVQVGTSTSGKFQASVTLYDSPNFRRAGVNPSHRYAMQPLVLKSINSAGVTDYFDGLEPDIALQEDFGNLGTLGDPTEPLLQAALNDILLNGRRTQFSNPVNSEEIMGSNSFKPFGNEMWIDLDKP